MKHYLLGLLSLACLTISHAQDFKKYPLKIENIIPIATKNSAEVYKGKEVLTIEQENSREYAFSIVKETDFHNGVIEIEVAGQPSVNAPAFARGFVGVAFRVSKDTSKFELLYVRPTNARSDDQVRRNHSTQYISYPSYPWEKLREESPEKYESYADLVSGEWTKITIEVTDDKARLFVNGASQPSLIINDLKHGKDLRGRIALWIGPGTIARFSELKIKKLD